MRNILFIVTLRITGVFLLGIALSSSALAQKFGFDAGIKGGVPLTNFLESTGVIDGNGFSSITRSSEFFIGPAVELTIPFGFAVEADGLYHRAEYGLNVSSPSSVVQVLANSWELAYLAKFRFPIPLVKPFVIGGGAYRNFTDLSPTLGATNNALVLGAGAELKVRRLRLSGEFRYLHWSEPSSADLARASQNQGEFLLGVMF